jgi:hypothetical protein
MYPVIFIAAATNAVGVPMKLSEDDSFLTWTEVVIPSLAGMASLSVAIVSVVIAWQARNIAKSSEHARVTAATDRLQFENQLRFDAALKDLYVGISQRIEALRAHDAGVRANMLNLGRGGPGVTVPARPPISSLLALIAAARLDARENEPLELLDSVAAHATDVAQTGGSTPDPETRDERQRRVEGEVDSWARLLICVDEWRHSGPDTRRLLLSEMKAASI